LIALFNQKLGKPVGYLNSVLYSLPANTNTFHNITVGNNDIKGNNGAYQASAGWNACTGLGSPNGANLLSAIQSVTEK
jgi:kumamolisin